VEGHHGVLELVRADHPGQVPGDQQERVADRDVAAPDVDTRVASGRQTFPALLVRERQQPCLTDQVGLGVAGRGDVELVTAHHRHHHAQRAGCQAAALPAVTQPPIGVADRLLQAVRDPRGLVVVVLAPDGVGHQRSRLTRLAPVAGPAGDDDEEAALGAADRADVGLGDEQRIRRGLQPVLLGYQTDLEVESDRHGPPSLTRADRHPARG
jgi:hypothetical protein